MGTGTQRNPHTKRLLAAKTQKRHQQLLAGEKVLRLYQTGGVSEKGSVQFKYTPLFFVSLINKRRRDIIVDLTFKTSLSEQQVEDNFKNIDFFSGIMEGLEEALEYERGKASAETFARKQFSLRIILTNLS